MKQKIKKEIEVISCMYSYQLQAQVNEAYDRIGRDRYIESVVYLSQEEWKDNECVGRFQTIITFY